jgi:hypothetical protein
VEGELVAIGTEEYPIKFLSSKAEPAHGDWGGNDKQKLVIPN